MYEVEICAAYVCMVEQCLPESLDKVLLCIVMLNKIMYVVTGIMQIHSIKSDTVLLLDI